MDLTELALKFLQSEFVDPIRYHQGYKPIMTITYAVILFAVAFFLIYPYFDKKKIKFNFSFLLALVPYILFATGIRIFEDMRIIARAWYPWQAGYYLISPGIWIAIGLLVIACLIIAKKISEKTGKDIYKVFAGIGLLIWIPVAITNLIFFRRWFGFLEIIAGTTLVVGIAYYILKFLKIDLLKSKINIATLAAQSLDGTATVIAMVTSPRFVEQHFVSAAILDVHPFLFIIVKVILVLFILHYVDKEIENENLRNFIKIIIFILGFATGSRDTLTFSVGSDMF